MKLLDDIRYWFSLISMNPEKQSQISIIAIGLQELIHRFVLHVYTGVIMKKKLPDDSAIPMNING